MNHGTMSQGMKVGELARRIGVTVRTLHHYDEIGLLQPSGRTESGHRLYDESQLRRLQQIASLRHLGLSLEDVRACLERPDYTLGYVLELHIERIEKELARSERLHDLLCGLHARVTSPSGASVEELAEVIEATLSLERYYSTDQLEWLARRRHAVGSRRMEEAQREWSELFSAFEDAQAEGLQPDDLRVLELARRSAALIEEFTGGDAGIERSLSAMYETEGPGETMARHGMALSPGLWEYMAAARAALSAGAGP